MSITVMDAAYKRGYSSTDHLLDDTEFDRIIGQTFPTLAKAREAADKAASRHTPVWIEILGTDGQVRTF